MTMKPSGSEQSDPIAWRMVRLPVELCLRIESMAREMERAHVTGRSTLPNEFADWVPHHHVVARALADWEAHRKRSRVRRRKRRQIKCEEDDDALGR